MRLGYEVVMIEDACRGIGIPLGIGIPQTGGRTTVEQARERLLAIGVRIITSSELIA